MRRLLIIAMLALGSLAWVDRAQALTIGGPGFYVDLPVYAAAPPPVYVAPPPPPVYVAPPPVYVTPPPVVVAPPPLYGPRPWRGYAYGYRHGYGHRHGYGPRHAYGHRHGYWR